MKKILIIIAGLFILAGCEKEKSLNPVYIDAPVLPADGLYWDMPLLEFQTKMKNAGYSSGNNGLFHDNGMTLCWGSEFSYGKLTKLIYYCLDMSDSKVEEERVYWLSLLDEGLGSDYKEGIITWKVASREEVPRIRYGVNNTKIAIQYLGSPQITVGIGNTPKNPRFWVIYSQKWKIYE